MAIATACALLAAGAQAARLARPGGVMSGGSYDTSLYLASAVHLVHGALPYRDFVLLQPPGLPIVLSPFALLSELMGTRGALSAWSICHPLLAALNVLLAGRLVRHRGWPAVLWACLLVAIYPAMYLSLQDGQLEVLMILFVLLGLNLAFDGEGLKGTWGLAGGAALLGYGASVLIAAAVPIVVFLAAVAWHARRRLLAAVGGTAVGVLAPCLPFLILAPASFVRDTVIAQLTRAPGAVRTPVLARINELGFAEHTLTALLVIGVIALIIALAFIWRRRALSALEFVALASTIGMGGVQFAIARYYPHFAAMFVPFLAILVGVLGLPLRRPPVGEVGDAPPRAHRRAVGDGSHVADLGAELVPRPGAGCRRADPRGGLCRGRAHPGSRGEQPSGVDASRLPALGGPLRDVSRGEPPDLSQDVRVGFR